MMAVDIVVLPTEDIIDMAVAINQHLEQDKISLNKKDCVPHVSIAMGCVKEENLRHVCNVIKDISRNFPRIRLKVEGIVATCFDDKKVQWLKVSLTDHLRKLHEEVMKRVRRYFCYDAKRNMFIGDVDKATVEWVKNYAKSSSFDKFSPHITLGFGELKMGQNQVSFNAEKIALFQLGNHCTCKKLLASYKFRGDYKKLE